ncbi:MAG: Holliday junction branch migration protein RuvA [Gammaproteobacteria bacterium]|nr:Holliday junction branch migration protein RuvA [Gammaproteobacteria bacterium]
MIGRLEGEIIEKQAPYLLLDVNGVGYELEAPMSTFYELPECGQLVMLHTHLMVRDDAHTLYAFKQIRDRSLFRNLLKVNGVGAKMALAILSGMDSNAFTQCIHHGDVDSLVRIPGVGKKTAERLILDMRDRLDKEVTLQVASNGKNGNGVNSYVADPIADAVSALVSLGYKTNEASRMVSTVDTKNQNSEDIIRQALKTSMS